MLHQLLMAFGPASEGDSAGDDPAEQLSEVLPDEGITWEQVVIAIAIVVVAVALSRLIKRVLINRLQAADTDLSMAVFVSRIVADAVVVLGIFYGLNTLGVELTPLIGALGIGGLAIAFAAQTILANTFASIVIRTSKPFKIGDQITTNDHDGTVEDINFRVVTLRSYDGERVQIPSAMALDNPLVNHTANGVRRSDVVVGVAYDTPLEAARDALGAAVASVEEVRATPPPEVFAVEFNASSIDFVVRFWHQPDIATFFRVRSAVILAVKRALDEADITIPFPQRTLGFLPDENVMRVAGDGEQ